MRIIELKAENFQRLSSIAIRPDEDVVQIGGLNEQGKTSVLDSIWAALGGGRAISEEPIRKGQESALIKLDLGELKVTRTFSRKEDGGHTTALKVVAANGARFDKAQDVLNAIWNAYAVDPLRFVDLPPKEQFDALKQFVPDVDFAAMARATTEEFEARTAANRRASDLRAQAEGIMLPPGKIPAKVDVTALEKQLADASDHNTVVERRRAGRDAMALGLTTKRAQVAEYRRLADELQREVEQQQAELDAAAPLPDPIDAAAVQVQLAAARRDNSFTELAERRAKLENDAKVAETEAADLTKRMEARAKAKQEAIAAAKMPVEGISFGDDCILLDGVPFAQGSTSRRIRAGVEIAAAMNPRLRVVRISDGSLLDRNARAWLAKFAAEKDLQVWIEVVGEGPAGFVIEDGHLQGEEPAPPAAAEDEEAV